MQNHDHHNQDKEHGKHLGHSVGMFAQKFWVSLALTIPVLVYSDILGRVFGFSAPSFLGSVYLPLVFSSIVFFYGGWVFIVGAYQELRERLPGMMTLISMAIGVAYFYSIFAVFSGEAETLFWELTTLITIMLLGHYLEMKAVAGAKGALAELSKLLPDTAEVIRNGKTMAIALTKLKVGDTVLVKPGSKIPADGKIVEGASEINESMVTGESKLVEKSVGSCVIAGTINGDGGLKVSVEKIGERTFLAGVLRLVTEAQASKSRLQIFSDKAAFYLTVIAIGFGSITFVSWLVLKAGAVFAIERLVAVLVIACPHALGLAVPLVASISTTLAARNGILVKQRLALEAARKIDTVLFDKTGTLTRGEYGVEKIVPASLKFSEEKILQLAASIEFYSEHAVAKALVKAANKKALELLEVRDFQRIPGKGVKGVIEFEEIFVGAPEKLRPDLSFYTIQGKTVIFVGISGQEAGFIILGDIIREESYKAVKSLKRMGLKVVMITGDSDDTAMRVAGELGIDEYFAKVLPGQKAEKIKLLQSSGRKVAMVGDGVNDAPALTQADLGIAIGAGTNVAIESAGIILVKNDLRDIVKLIKLSRATYSKMIQNLFWATGYNVIAMPLAAGVLFSRGIVLEPALGALMMSLSTVIVSVNAVWLKKSVKL